MRTINLSINNDYYDFALNLMSRFLMLDNLLQGRVIVINSFKNFHVETLCEIARCHGMKLK